MFISVVIPTYNRRSILEKCLQALEHQDPSGEIETYEVVVVDDGSSDGTPDWLRQNAARFPHVQLVEQQHGGPAEGRNRGVDHAKGDVSLSLGLRLPVVNTRKQSSANIWKSNSQILTRDRTRVNQICVQGTKKVKNLQIYQG